MPTTGFRICKVCLTSFDSEQALEGHIEYMKYRRKSPAGYDNSFSNLLVSPFKRDIVPLRYARKSSDIQLIL